MKTDLLAGGRDTDGGQSPPPGSLAATPRDALAAVPWLASVPARTLDRLARQAVLYRVPPRSMLFEQAETPAFAQFLVGGSVELLALRETEETLVELVRPVDLLLPAAVLNRQPYLLRARVLEEAHLLMIEAETFRRGVAADHALCLAVLACQAAQFRRQVKHAKNVRLRSAEERVGTYLLKLVEGAPAGATAKLPVEKRLVASKLGMTRETLSRIFASLSRHGVRVEGDLVSLDDADAARARFQLDSLIDGPEAILPLPIERT